MAVVNLTEQEMDALDAFAAAKGRQWKTQLLCVYWYNARIWRDSQGSDHHGTVLHALRNKHGHSAVEKYKPRKVAV